jgi:hypothetical protein
MRPHRTVALLAASLTVLVAVPVGWLLTRPADSVGQPPATAGASAPATAQGSLPAATPTVPVRPAVPAPAPERIAPVRLAVPSAGVDAQVLPVGVAADGQVEIPEDASRVGWYRFGPGPTSEQGSVVLVGHRDSRSQGAGALFRLDRVRPGDRITVTLADRTAVAYRVVERRQYDKQVVPLAQLFDRTGSPRLTVITCGGPYDAQLGGYQNNLVVTAVPLGIGPA